MRKLLTLVLFAAVPMASFTVAPTTARAEIILDFLHADSDTSDNLFNGANSSLARAAVQKAADDINAVLNASLNPISNYAVVGSGSNGSGSTTLTFDFDLTYTNPSTGAIETFNPTGLGTNEIRVFVGSRSLGGSTLGQGGPGGAGVFVSGSSSGAGAVAEATADAEALSNDLFGRGGQGPDVLTLSSDVAGNPYDVTFGSTLGNLWFDIDTDNNSVADSSSDLANFWHLDANASVASGKNDLYSTALHELLHVVGIGDTESWLDLISPFVDESTPRDWLGPNVAALTGSGSGLIEPDAAHILTGTTSTRLSDGTIQEVVMDPSLTTGTRKELTELDLAFLQDLGWTNASAIPEPTSFAVIGFTALVCIIRRSRR